MGAWTRGEAGHATWHLAWLHLPPFLLSSSPLLPGSPSPRGEDVREEKNPGRGDGGRGWGGTGQEAGGSLPTLSQLCDLGSGGDLVSAPGFQMKLLD